MSFGPPPSQLCLISALPSREVGDKVRFLGCVTSYYLAAGQLTLEHRLPDENRSVRVIVDVNLVLESLGSDQTRVGEWVNVIGYVTSANIKGRDAEKPTIQVQAILLWSAGPLNLQKYEVSVKALDSERN
ncbi:protein ten1 [Podospora australis]|uniref:Protein ten1 n=1 Tax=Podospora australis TaxID=1536484 RepID=A0AAN6X289_9PEZI|nr:protein ten1 [Podospora australis]